MTWCRISTAELPENGGRPVNSAYSNVPSP